MPNSRTTEEPKPQRIGIAADHGGFELKQHLVGKLREAGHAVIDFGDSHSQPDDDYPDFVVPLARAVAQGDVDRGVAVCGSGVGACVAANKVAGVRAGLSDVLDLSGRGPILGGSEVALRVIPATPGPGFTEAFGLLRGMALEDLEGQRWETSRNTPRRTTLAWGGASPGGKLPVSWPRAAGRNLRRHGCGGGAQVHAQKPVNARAASPPLGAAFARHAARIVLRFCLNLRSGM